MFPDSAAIKRKVLQRERVGAYRMISRYVLDNAEYELIDHLAHGLMVQLVSEVLTERIAPEKHVVSFEVPKTWWQHFKHDHRDRFGFRWLIKRWPIVYDHWRKTVEFDAKKLYPNADIPRQVTPLGRPIMFETIGESDWSNG